MKKQRLLSIGLLTVCTVGFGAAMFILTNNSMKLKTVYIYNKNVTEMNSQVKVTDFLPVQIPSSAITDQFLLDLGEIQEKYYNTTAQKGHYVYKDDFTTQENLDVFDSLNLANMRKISLPVNYIEGLAGNIKRGDKVDIIYTGKGITKETDGSTGEDFTYAKTVLHEVLVESVSTTDGYLFTNHSDRTEMEIPQGNASTGEIGIITLAVTLEQAEEIKARQETGILSVVGRFDKSETYPTVGYVVGNYGKIFSGSANAETGQTTIQNNGK